MEKWFLFSTRFLAAILSAAAGAGLLDPSWSEKVGTVVPALAAIVASLLGLQSVGKSILAPADKQDSLTLLPPKS
jgi:hypothetical protein